MPNYKMTEWGEEPIAETYIQSQDSWAGGDGGDEGMNNVANHPITSIC
jgi:hypothetical protein